MSLPSNLRVSNSSYLIVPHSEDFNFGSDDFTIELWIKFNSWLNDRGIVTKGWPSHAGAFLIYTTSDSRIAFYASSDGSSWNIANNQTMASGITLNTWYHIAVTRSGSTFRTFVNGSLTSSWSNGSALVNNISKNLAIGNGDTGQHPIDGWIDGLRITKGIARYTSTFVPSSLDHPIESSFKDGSRFNKPVSNKGPTTISSANSQFGGSSGYFDGSSYLSVPGDKAWQFGTDDFTVEGWINPDEISSTVQSIVGNYDGADGGWRLGVKAGLPEPPTSLLLHFNGNNGSTNIIDSSTNKESISTNGSVQISTAQNMFGGSSLKLGGTSDYLDGLSGVNLSSGSYTVEFWFLAEQNNAGDNYNVVGCGYNSWPSRWVLDIAVGSNKIYPRFITEWNSVVMNGEAAYTLGSWAHIAYVNNIATNNLSIYVNGVKVTERSAVNLTKYSTMQIGRNSGAYQNVGPYYIDELRISPIAVYTSNFTPPSSALPDPASNNSVIQFRNGNSSIIEKTVTPPLSTGTWYHIAASRSSNSLKLFLDGNELGESATDPYYSNVSLLLHADGNHTSTTFIDNSPSPKAITVNGNTQISTIESKFGGGSAYFDGNGDYISINPDGSFADLGIISQSSQYTIEFWVMPTTTNNSTLLCHALPGSGGNGIGGWRLSSVDGGKIQFTISRTYTSPSPWVFMMTTDSTVLSSNEFTHIALVIRNGFPYIYANGIQQSITLYTPSSIWATTPIGFDTTKTNYGLTIGSAEQDSTNSRSDFFAGYIDELRISQGIARYFSNFTPSTNPFPNQGPFTADLNRINTNGLTIGSSRSSSNVVSDVYKGYIDDLRITKGVARYTASFARPAAPAPALGPAPIAPNSPTGLAVTERDNIFKVSLTPPSFDGRSPITSYNFQYSENGSTWNNVSVVSDPYYDKVSLLLPMTGPNNSFNIFDDSKYNHNISIVGDTKISTAQSWFNNGSALFDGSNDNLVIENNEAFDLRNQDWTIEGWIRPTGDWSKYNTIISKRGNGGSEGTDSDWQLYLRQSNGVLSFYSATPGGQQESGSAPYINVWNHVAAVRNGKTITLYLNGISVLSFVADTSYTANRKVYVGGWPAGNEYFYGNMNDIRVTKGVARYTSNFDPRLLSQSPANRVTGLSTVGTPYIFRARSVNAVGSSQYSTSTTSAITILGAPSNLNVIPDSDKAYLSWTAPTSNNSAIRDYSIQYSADNGTTWTDHIHNASINTSIVVDGLTIGTNYSFRVAAINMAGVGSYVTSTAPVLTALREDNTYNKTRLLLHLDSN